MKRRIWSPLLTVFSLIGGGLGWFAGEMLLDRWSGEVHDVLLMGLYFGLLAFFVGLACLLAEMISPKLNGRSWRDRYASDGWKLLLPATLVLLFAAGTLFQWIYGLQLAGFRTVTPNDYVLVFDKSESMRQNDPNQESLSAAQGLVDRMDTHTRLAVLAFNENVTPVQAMTALKNDGVKAEIKSRMSAAAEPVGETDIGKALNAAMEEMKAAGTPAQRGTVILISDGYSPMQVAQVTAPFVQNGFKIHTVGLETSPNDEGTRLMNEIALATGGSFQSVKSAERVTEAFERIYTAQHPWHLVNERTGEGSEGLLHAILRVGSVLLIGLLMGLSLGILFDNRFLARSFMLGGLLAGLLAGLLLELGLPGSADPWLIRGGADLLLAVVLSLATLMFAVNTGNPGAGLFGRSRMRGAAETPAQDRFGRGDRNNSGRQFR